MEKIYELVFQQPTIFLQYENLRVCIKLVKFVFQLTRENVTFEYVHWINTKSRMVLSEKKEWLGVKINVIVQQFQNILHIVKILTDIMNDRGCTVSAALQ